jgi:hypothetical protein
MFVITEYNCKIKFTYFFQLFGFLIVTINAVFGREDGPSEDRNKLSTIQPLRAEDPGNGLPTIQPRKLDISSIFEKNSEVIHLRIIFRT